MPSARLSVTVTSAHKARQSLRSSFVRRRRHEQTSTTCPLGDLRFRDFTEQLEQDPPVPAVFFFLSDKQAKFSVTVPTWRSLTGFPLRFVAAVAPRGNGAVR